MGHVSTLINGGLGGHAEKVAQTTTHILEVMLCGKLDADISKKHYVNETSADIMQDVNNMLGLN